MDQLLIIFIIQVVLWILLFVLIYYLIKKNTELKKEIKLLRDTGISGSDLSTEHSRRSREIP
jgi:hypothetical protein